MQECLLENLRIFLEYQPYSVIANQLLPAICDLFSTTTSLNVKVLSIKALIMTVEGIDGNSLDNYTIIEKVLPPVRKTQSSNLKNHEIFANILRLYMSIFKKLALSKNTISIENQELPIYDVILESLFFEIWKLTKYADRKDDMDSTFMALETIEKFLKNATSNRISGLPQPKNVSHIDTGVTVSLKKNVSERKKNLVHQDIPSVPIINTNNSLKSFSGKFVSTNNAFGRTTSLTSSTVSSLATSNVSNIISAHAPSSPSSSSSPHSFMMPMKATKKTASKASIPAVVSNGWTRYESSNESRAKNQDLKSIFEPIKPTKRLR